MQRSGLVAQVSALIVTAVALPAFVWASSSPAPTDADRPGISQVKDKEHVKDHGHGPPAWAHGHRAKPGKDAGKAWKQLSPEERSTLMRKLTREHSQGMRAWSRCVAAARDDCSRPLPPGLAKRL